MEKTIQTEKFPYNIKSPLIVKIISALLIPLELWLLWSFSTLINEWNEGNILGTFAFLISVLSIPFFVLIVFFTKTTLHNNGIIHINRLLRKKQFPYEDIENISVVGNGDIKLDLSDGSSIQILCGIDKQTRVLNLIKSKTCNP